MLSIELFSQGSELDQKINARFLENESNALVFSSRLGELAWLRRREETLWQANLLSLGELWSLAGLKLDTPLPLPGFTLAERLADLIKDNEKILDPKLVRLMDSAEGLKSLGSHLDKLAEKKRGEYALTNKIERDIYFLSQQLNQAGILSPATFRSEVARFSDHVQFDYENILIYPPANFSPEFGKFILGLSQNNNICLYLLGEARTKEDLLRSLGLEDIEVRNNPNSYITEIKEEFYYANSPYEAAIEIAKNSGLSNNQIAFVVKDNQNTKVLEDLARQRGMCLLARRRVRVNDCALGHLFLKILSSWEEKEDFSLDTGENEEVINLLKYKSREPLQILEELLNIGHLIVEETDGDSLLYLEGLEQRVLNFKGATNYPLDPKRFLMITTSNFHFRGDPNGILLLDFDEPINLGFKKLIFLDMEESGWPGEAPANPFIGAPFKEANPDYNDFDWQLYLSLWQSAGNERVYLRQRVQADGTSLAPGIAYLNALSKSNLEERPFKESDFTSPLRLRQRAIREGKLFKELEEVLLRFEESSEVSFARYKNEYSISELEEYLRCPASWAIKYFFALESENRKTRLGSVAHSLLANFDLDKPSQDTSKWLDKHLQNASITQLDRRLLKQWLLSTLDNSYYSWQGIILGREVDLRYYLDEDFGEFEGVTINGRLDRVDQIKEKALVIDYKLGSLPSTPLSKNKKHKQLQRYLYPQMAAREFDLEPYGLIYVHIASNAHSGSLTQYPPFGLEEADSDYESGLKGAHEQMLIAIDGIRSGRVQDKCGESWCVCHLLDLSV